MTDSADSTQDVFVSPPAEQMDKKKSSSEGGTYVLRSGQLFLIALALHIICASAAVATWAGAVVLVTAFGLYAIATTLAWLKVLWADGSPVVRLAGSVTIVAASWMFWTAGPPSERVIGPNDEAVYANAAMHIARTGTLRYSPAFLDYIPSGNREALLRKIPVQAQRSTEEPVRRVSWEPGFPLQDVTQGLVTPAFPPGWPVFFSAVLKLAGWHAGHYTNAVLIFFCGIIISLLAARWLGRWTAILILPVFWLFPLHTYFSRSLYAEPLLQLLWLTSLLGLSFVPVRTEISGPAKGARLPWVLAIASLAMCSVVKLEALLMIPPAVLAITLWRVRLKVAASLAGSFVFVLGSGLLLAGYSSPYLIDTLRTWLNPEALASLGGAAILAGFALFAIRVATNQGRYSGLWIVTVLVVAGGLYCYFLRPLQLEPDTFAYLPAGGVIRSFREETLVRLGWYFHPLALAIAMLGFLVLAWRCRSEWQAILFATALLFLALLVFDLRNNPAQPYAMRRLISCVTPVLCLGFAALWEGLRPNLGFRITGLCATVALVAWFQPINRQLCAHPNHNGLAQQLTTLAAKIPENALVVSSAASPLSMLSPALQFIHGKNAYVCPDHITLREHRALTAALEEWRAKRGPVYSLRDAFRLPHGVGEPVSGEIDVQFLPDDALKIPSQVERIQLAYIIKEIEPDPMRRARSAIPTSGKQVP